MTSSPVAGTAVITSLAPPSTCARTRAASVQTPVDSTITFTPTSPHGRAAPTRPGITRLVTRLARDWLAQQRPVPSDRRVALARLTPERRREKAEALPALTRLAELAQHRP
ncbi:hypothetical protein [Streptomyces sp. GbtcB7]|uniref:hypothetical protein n=1 Tax=Streptomyces sp. GbtcB7 TaxID=2824752 RepID=UPI001C30AB32|nr:hypothetical protein [Streptomyces sp. GbtcB7]